jgi:hypothetical protein
VTYVVAFMVVTILLELALSKPRPLFVNEPSVVVIPVDRVLRKR